MRGLRGVAGLLLVAVVAGCGPTGVGPGVGERPGESPDQYAAALDSREVSRRIVPALVAGLVEAVGGAVRSATGRYEACRFAGDESTAFEYAVTVVLARTRVEPGLETVAQVLRSEGWVLTDPVSTEHERQRVGAARGGVGLGVHEGDPASTLVLRSGAGCFDVPARHRNDLGDLGADRLEVPEVG